MNSSVYLHILDVYIKMKSNEDKSTLFSAVMEFNPSINLWNK